LLLILREYLLLPVFAAYPPRAPVVTRVCCLSFASTCCHPCLLFILREYLLSPVFAAYPPRAPVVTRVCCLSFASTCCHPCLLLILREHLLSPVFAAYPSRVPVVTRVCCLSSASTNAYFSLQYFVNPCSCFRPYPLRLMDSDYPFDIFKTFLPSPGLRTVPT
jgi:hypothetical protein